MTGMLGAPGSAGGYVVFGRFKIVDNDADDADAERDPESESAEERGGCDSGSSTESEYYEDADYDAPALALIAKKLKSGLSALPDNDDSDSSESDDDRFFKEMAAKRKSDDEHAALFGSSDSDDADEEYGADDGGNSDHDSKDDIGEEKSDSSDGETTSNQELLPNASIMVGIEQAQLRNQEASRRSEVREPNARLPPATADHVTEEHNRSDSDILMDTTSIRKVDYDPDAVFGSSDSDEEDLEGDNVECDGPNQGEKARDLNGTGQICHEPQTDIVQTLSKSANTVEICSVAAEKEGEASNRSETLDVRVDQTNDMLRSADRERSDSDITLFGSSIPKEDYDPAEVFGSSDSDEYALEDENPSCKCGEDAKHGVIDATQNAQCSICSSNAQAHHEYVQALSSTDEGANMESCLATAEKHTPFQSISQGIMQNPTAPEELLGLREADHTKHTIEQEPEYRCKTCPALLPPPMPNMIGLRQCTCCGCVYPPSKFDWARHRCKLCSPFVIWRCGGCGLSLPKAAFSKAQRSRKNGSRCKKCIQAGRCSAAPSAINNNKAKTNGYAGMSDAVLNRRLAELLGETLSLKRKHKEGGLDALTTTEIETLHALSSELARRTAEVLARSKQPRRNKRTKHTKVKI